jgi:thiamine biosynthesis lipoprotein
MAPITSARQGSDFGRAAPLRFAASGLFAILWAVLLVGCASPTIHRYRQIVMGVEATVSIACDDEARAVDAGRLAFARLAELEQVMSDYRPDSELMRLCATHDIAVPVSADLFEVIERADEVRKASRGAFDISVGPLTLLWREARRSQAFPTEEAIAAARKRTGGDAVVLDRNAHTVTLAKAGMRLDLGGIGKGYAAAKTVAALRAAGYPQTLVAVAGDIAAGDAPPGKSAWNVQLEWPDGTRESLALVRASVSTSGDREQYFEHAGIRYSHLLDPNTGLGSTTQRQVTVTGPDGAIVDALSSALTIADDTTVRSLTRAYAPTYRAIFQRDHEPRALPGRPTAN